MLNPRHWPLLAAGLLLPLALAGCPDMPLDADPGQAASGLDAEGKPVAFPLLSEHDAAGWSDVAIAPDGTLHVVYSDTPKGGESTIYHRSSQNGATWSEPLRLSVRDQAAGRPRIAIDGQGRLYAFWKDMDENGGDWMTAGGRDSLRGGPYGRPLMGAVMANGAWSAPFQVSETIQVVSWFPSVDPNGKLHLVWTEAIQAPNGYQTTDPALVMQATLSGSTVESRQELYRAEPNAPAGYDGTAWYYEKNDSLRGYVGADGVARWVTAQTPGTGDTDETMVMYWDGTQHTPLFKYYAYAGDVDGYYNPPELVLDATGQAHVLIQDTKGDREAVLDFALGSDTPKTVREAPDVSGKLRTFQVARGPNGELAAMMTFRDKVAADTEYELFVSRYQDGAWTTATNVTNNAARGSYKEFGTQTDGVQSSTAYEPAFAAAAFDAQGRLNMAMVNMEKIYTNIANTGTHLGEAVTVNQGGVVALPKVFFVRL